MSFSLLSCRIPFAGQENELQDCRLAHFICPGSISPGEKFRFLAVVR